VSADPAVEDSFNFTLLLNLVSFWSIPCEEKVIIDPFEIILICKYFAKIYMYQFPMLILI
jgi:hypothetical protein